MKKQLRYLFFISLLSFLPGFVLAQKSVTGTVTSEEGDPLIGANILIQGTATSTVTDLDGNYQLDDVPEDGVLVFSYTGYAATEVPVQGRDVIDVSLEPSVGLLDEVVVVGYSKQKKVTVTGAVVALPGKDLIQSPAVDMSNSLAGRLPGVFVIQTSGEPGFDSAHVGRPRDELRDVDFKARYFNSFWEVAEETADSRFYGGIHTPQDNEVGLQEGRRIGQHVNALNWRRERMVRGD